MPFGNLRSFSWQPIRSKDHRVRVGQFVHRISRLSQIGGGDTLANPDRTVCEMNFEVHAARGDAVRRPGRLQHYTRPPARCMAAISAGSMGGGPPGPAPGPIGAPIPIPGPGMGIPPPCGGIPGGIPPPWPPGTPPMNACKARRRSMSPLLPASIACAGGMAPVLGLLRDLDRPVSWLISRPALARARPIIICGLLAAIDSNFVTSSSPTWAVGDFNSSPPGPGPAAPGAPIIPGIIGIPGIIAVYLQL